MLFAIVTAIGLELAEYLGLPAEAVYPALGSLRLVNARRRGGPESVWVPRVVV